MSRHDADKLHGPITQPVFVSVDPARDTPRAIARYLDKTYPDTPRLIPPEADALTAAFEDAFWRAFPRESLGPIVYPAAFKCLREKSRPFFRETREKIFGKKLEEIWGDEAAVKKAKADGKEGLTWVEAMVKENGDTALFLLGDSPVDADFAIASVFQWIKKGYPAMWGELKGLNGGRWARFMEAMHQYEDEN